MTESLISAAELLKAGAHFGHRSSRWNPKMKRYIFSKTNLIHIIDIKETLRGILRANYFLSRISAQGQGVLFVGTKRQAKGVVANVAAQCNMHYVAERWLGGTLTNHGVIRARLERLLDIERMEEDGSLHRYGKKEISRILREKRKLKRNLDGIRNMNKIPGAVVVVDPTIETNAVLEARRLGIVSIALLDTDGDPEGVDIPIPINDDSMQVIKLVLERLACGIDLGASSWIKKMEELHKKQEEEKKASEARKAEADRRRKLESDKLKAEKILKDRRAKQTAAKVAKKKKEDDGAAAAPSPSATATATKEAPKPTQDAPKPAQDAQRTPEQTEKDKGEETSTKS